MDDEDRVCRKNKLGKNIAPCFVRSSEIETREVKKKLPVFRGYIRCFLQRSCFTPDRSVWVDEWMIFFIRAAPFLQKTAHWARLPRKIDDF